MAEESRPSSLNGQLMLRRAQTLRIDVHLVAEPPPFPQAQPDTFRAFFFSKKKYIYSSTPFPLQTTPDYRSSPWRLYTLPRGDGEGGSIGDTPRL